MVNINLTTEKISIKEPSLFKKETTILTVLLSLLIVAYGGMLWYEKGVIKKTQGKDAEYSKAYQEITEGNAKGVFDFQNRLNSASSLFSTSNLALDNLKKMENVIIPGVNINSFSYDVAQEKMILELAAGSYSLMAKQILSFKKSNYFSDVSVSGSQIRENNIIFPVNLTLNK